MLQWATSCRLTSEKKSRIIPCQSTASKQHPRCLTLSACCLDDRKAANPNDRCQRSYNVTVIWHWRLSTLDAINMAWLFRLVRRRELIGKCFMWVFCNLPSNSCVPMCLTCTAISGCNFSSIPDDRQLARAVVARTTAILSVVSTTQIKRKKWRSVTSGTGNGITHGRVCHLPETGGWRLWYKCVWLLKDWENGGGIVA